MSKHKIIAILMAPFLAIGGYIAAGYFASPGPPMRTFVAEQGCDLVNNRCELQTPGLTLKVSVDSVLHSGESVAVTVKSSESINDAVFSLAEKNQQDMPVRLQRKEDGLWRGEFFINENHRADKLRLRLVIDWNKQVYFADEQIVSYQ